MIKYRKTAVLLGMLLLLASLGGCSESGPAPEASPAVLDEGAGSFAGAGNAALSTSFDTEQSERMASFMGENRALLAENMLYCLAYDEDYAPVLASYEIVDGSLTGFSILAEDCVPRYLSLWEGRLYYINGSGSASIESIAADGSDRRVLVGESCRCLQIWDGSLYFCDASGRFCRADGNGGEKTVLIDDTCFYAYCMDGSVLYQSGSDGESLHLFRLEDGTDTKLTGTVSYAPVRIENTLWYTQKTDEGSRIGSLSLETGALQTYDMPPIQGAAEFIHDGQLGWCARVVPADVRQEQSVIPLAELESGAWSPCGYSGYRLCDWAGPLRIDAAYENGGRLRSFVLVSPDGSETEYLSAQIRQK